MVLQCYMAFPSTPGSNQSSRITDRGDTFYREAMRCWSCPRAWWEAILTALFQIRDVEHGGEPSSRPLWEAEALLHLLSRSESWARVLGSLCYTVWALLINDFRTIIWYEVMEVLAFTSKTLVLSHGSTNKDHSGSFKNVPKPGIELQRFS